MIYFIGLGGTGLYTVSELAKLYKDVPDSNQYMFTYIDTDKNDYNKINRQNDEIISSNSFVDLGAVIPYQQYDTANKTPTPNATQKRLLEWCISQEKGHLNLPNYPLHDGATAQRMVGRFAMLADYENLTNQLRSNISRFKDAQPNEKGKRDIDIWVVASSCGGTGSSMLLDVLYLINMLACDVEDAEPNVKLVLYMPKPYIDKYHNNDNLPLNGYACLWEIDSFRHAYETNRGKLFENFAVHPTPTQANVKEFPLYRFLIPIDRETNIGYHIPLDNLYPTVAHMMYYLNYGNAGHDIKKSLSNDVAQLLNNPPEHTRSLIGYGFRAIKKANDELQKYLRVRGLYEILQYGLLDTNNEGTIKDEKVRFTNDNILTHLVSFETGEDATDFRGMMRTDSLEVQIKALFPKVELLSEKDMNANTMSTMSSNMKNITSESPQVQAIKIAIRNRVLTNIDVSVSNYIMMHGIKYVHKLLNTVDDFYLEPLIKDRIIPQIVALRGEVDKITIQCNAWTQKAKDKKVGKSSLITLRDKMAKLLAFELASDIIESLTENNTGYLEKLRKGDEVSIWGMSKIIDRLDAAKRTAEEKYNDLAETFRATDKDMMTVYLPSLSQLATGENGRNWEKNNFFSMLYRSSILNQENIKRDMEEIEVPVRTSPDNLGLKDYLQKINTDNLFLRLIKSNPLNGLDIDSAIVKPLERALSEASKTESGRPAAKWINMSLKEVLEDNDDRLLPKGVTNFKALCNSFADVQSIPFFYPTIQGGTQPVNTRLFYFGSFEKEEKIAKDLGFKGGDTQTWVKDDELNDQFVIIRMPIGLDFHSYRFFGNMQTRYNELIDDVENMRYGCHIHQKFNLCHDFNFLTRNMGMPDWTITIKNLVKALYYQHIVDLLKEKQSTTYSRLFGLNTELPQANPSTSDTSEDDDWLGESSAVATVSSTTFIRFTIDKENNRINLMLKKLFLDKATDTIEFDNSALNESYDKDNTMSCKNFITSLKPEVINRLASISIFDTMFSIDKDSALHATIESLKTEAKKRLREIRWEGELQFYAFVRRWTNLKMPSDLELINAIETTINNL